jgi:hypothetical protein
MVKNWF